MFFCSVRLIQKITPGCETEAMPIAFVGAGKIVGASLTYSFVLLVIALEMAEVENPSCRATSVKGIP
jgi:hypothetical protein